jgi:hypothetical protein
VKVRSRTLSSAVAFTVLSASAAAAQSADPLPGRIELAIGVQRVGEAAFGSRDANLTTATGSTLRLFRTTTTMRSASGIEGRVGVRVMRSFDVEAFGAYAKPVLETAIADDFEGATATTAAETIRQFVVGGGVLFYLPRLQSPRLRPFVEGSAAYLRQLHESDTLGVNGRVYEAGMGVKYLVVSHGSGKLNAIGVRADARVQARVRGVAFDEAAHYQPAFTASAFFRF